MSESQPTDEVPDAYQRPLLPPVSVPLSVMPEHACPYFPERVARYRAIRAQRIDPDVYHQFMDANFRRSGTVLYQPVCRSCSDCVQIRLPVTDFQPRKSQRRCWRLNADLSVDVGPPSLTNEKFELYRRYVLQWHGKPIDGDEPTESDLHRFLYDSPTDTLEFTYRDTTGRLLAVGICDVSTDSLSSVYFYFDPADAHRSLGSYGAMWEIDWARRHTIRYYYLGYWIKGCQKMDYKLTYNPAEVLDAAGQWIPAHEHNRGNNTG